MPKDETEKGTPKDESTEGTPGTNPKGTPKGKGKLYTEAEIDRLKADSASMGQGRAEKVAKQEKEALTQDLQSATSRLDALERETNEARLAATEGDPDGRRAYQREQAAARREREAADKERDIARREAQVKADREAVDADRGVVSVAYLAAKHGIAPERLEKLKITDPEQLELVAEEIAATKPPVAKTGKEGDEGTGPEEPDSGDTAGKGELTEQERLDERYPTMKEK